MSELIPSTELLIRKMCMLSIRLSSDAKLAQDQDKAILMEASAKIAQALSRLEQMGYA